MQTVPGRGEAQLSGPSHLRLRRTGTEPGYQDDRQRSRSGDTGWPRRNRRCRSAPPRGTVR